MIVLHMGLLVRSIGITIKYRSLFRFVGYLDLPGRIGQGDITENTRKGVAVRYLPRAETAQEKKSGDNWNQLSPLEMVAGVGFEPTISGL